MSEAGPQPHEVRPDSVRPEGVRPDEAGPDGVGPAGALERARQLLTGDPHAALAAAEEAARVALGQDDPRLQAEALQLAGAAHQLMAHDRTAGELLWKAAALFEVQGDRASQARALHMAAMSQLGLGHYRRALTLLEEALALARAVRDGELEVEVQGGLALARSRLGDFGRAGHHFDPGLTLRRQLGEAGGEAARFNNLAAEQIELADSLAARGEAVRARQSYAFALEVLGQAAQEPCSERLSGLLALNGGLALAALARPAEAERALEGALDSARRLGDRRLEARAQTELGALHLQEGRLDRAGEALEAAAARLAGSGAQGELARLEAVQTDLHERRGDFARALGHHRRRHALEMTLRAEAAEQQVQAVAARLDLQRARHEAELQRLRSEELEALVAARTTDLRRAQGEVVGLLAAAAESRDGPSGAHIRWVGEAACRLALRLGLGGAEAADLGLAAQLHDIGKLAIPDAVLLKAGALTEAERALMRGHTEQGARILAPGSTPLLRLAREVALSHHEHWDGTGYPGGLRGAAIPLSGRIVSVVDAYDALVSERPYKAPWAAWAALGYLEDHAGAFFDPGVVTAFAALWRADGLPARE